MDWKEFFKLTKVKVIVSILIYLISYIFFKIQCMIRLACEIGDTACQKELFQANTICPFVYPLIVVVIVYIIVGIIELRFKK